MKVLLSNLAMTKIKYWVHASDVEISGLGKCVWDRQAEAYHVTDVYLLEQTNTGTSTDIEAGAVAKLLYETREVEGHLNFWWHSHVNMAVFWSGTDKATIKEFGDQGFCLATVFNKKGEMKSAYYQGATDFLPAVFMDNLETEEYTPVDPAVIANCKAEMDAKCKKPVYNFNKGGQQGKYGTKPRTGGTTGQTTGIVGITKDSLGFEYAGTDFQWERLASGENTYAGFLFQDVLNPKHREHASIHPNTYRIWDENRNKWHDYNTFKKNNPDDCTSMIFRAPFSDKDYSALCKLYRTLFVNPPCELVDIEELFVDIMDLDFHSFWHSTPDTAIAAYNEWLDMHTILFDIHCTNRKGA